MKTLIFSAITFVTLAASAEPRVLNCKNDSDVNDPRRTSVVLTADIPISSPGRIIPMSAHLKIRTSLPPHDDFMTSDLEGEVTGVLRLNDFVIEVFFIRLHGDVPLEKSGVLLPVELNTSTSLTTAHLTIEYPGNPEPEIITLECEQE